MVIIPWFAAGMIGAIFPSVWIALYCISERESVIDDNGNTMFAAMLVSILAGAFAALTLLGYISMGVSLVLAIALLTKKARADG